MPNRRDSHAAPTIVGHIADSPSNWIRVIGTLMSALENIAKAEVFDAADRPLPSCPVVSFEGICGSGKTTQIEICRKTLESQGYRTHVAEVPSHDTTQTAFLLKALNRDRCWFEAVEERLPWLNPILISIDYLEHLRTVPLMTDVVLFSRGLLSTYMYNYPAILRVVRDDAATIRWLDTLLSTIPNPNLILYLQLPLEEAHRRSVMRGPGPLRPRETLRGLEETERHYERILSSHRFQNIPVTRVDATKSVDEISASVLQMTAHSISRRQTGD